MPVGNDGRTTRVVMADGCESVPSVYDTTYFFSPEMVIGMDPLYDSARRCWKGVSHKYSAQAYHNGIVAKTIELSRQLRHGKYKEGKTHIVHITYPKARTALSITFRDRVYQRSINDNALYPQVTKSFIWQNFACQKGKGTDAAREYFKAAMHRAYLRYGTADFYVLSGDIRHYYDNMLHSETERIFAKHADLWTAKVSSDTLRNQYKGDKGYNPGSQMVQIAGIAYLSGLDHYVKEQLKCKLYLRYMDDFKAIFATKEEAEEAQRKIAEFLVPIGMELHPVKTAIVKAKAGIELLGFDFRVTDTGKVLMMRSPRRVKEIRRRMRRLASKIRRGDCRREALAESYQCVRACMEKGDSKRLLRNMDGFYNSLTKEIDNGKHA